MGLTQIVGAGIAIVGLVIIDNQVDKIDWSASGTWLWIGSFAIILLTGAGLIYQSGIRSRSEVSSAAADSPSV
jgi:ABC-type nickel/cobalt efflux system permease component RcnA